MVPEIPATSTMVPHILVVDDEPDVADLFRQKFRREIKAGELRFSFAGNGEEALARVQEMPDISVVFTDLNMPVMNGLDLLGHLRALPGRLLRTVVVSAYGDMPNIRVAMNQGAMDFIVKPIDLKDLDLTLRKALGEVEEQAVARAAAGALEAAKLEKDAAEQARRMQKEFFDNITHELRTPLTLLLGPLELALDHTKEATVQQYLQVSHRNGRQLLTLIDELLDTARLEAGMMVLQAETVDLMGFCLSLAEDFAPLARAKGIGYVMEVPIGPVYTRFDPAKLRKVIANLLSNAFKFTAVGGEVSLEVVLRGSERAVIRVSDTGVGIPEEALPRVFERFYRTGEGGGTGIGLSLAKSLADLHGGDLRVRSEVGKGSTFELELPLVVGEVPTGMARMAGEVAVERPEVELPLVLVVEDHAEMRNYIRQCLEGSYDVVLAEDGEQGLNLAKTHVPDIVISDWTMPKMDGLEMGAALRADVGTSHIPIVMLSARAALEHRLEGLGGGADVYLSKPFHREELLLQVNNLLRRRSEWRAKARREVLTEPEVEAQPSMDDQFLRKVHAVLQKELANERFGVEQMADELGMSRKTLHRKLTAVTGQSPNTIIRNFKLEAAMQMLKNKSGPVGEISYLTGFSSHSYFSKCFQEYFHVSPSEV